MYMDSVSLSPPSQTLLSELVWGKIKLHFMEGRIDNIEKETAGLKDMAKGGGSDRPQK